MRLKSYFAGTVESAICLARQEMGEDAMLVNSRRTSPEARHLGAYEVVFAAAQDAPPERKQSAPASSPVEQPSPSLLTEMAEMRRQLAKVSAQVTRSSGGRRPAGARHHPALDEF